MTTLAIKGLSTHAQTALEPHIRRLWEDQRGTAMIVAELEHVARAEPGPASSAQPKVDVRVSYLEVPSGITQDLARMFMRSLYLLRTARGTLDEASGEVNLATESARIADSIGVLFATEAAEARSFLHQLLDQLEASQNMVDEQKRRRRLRKLTDAGRAFLGTGDRERLNALAQDELDLSGDEPAASIDVEATDQETRVAGETLASIGATEPVRVGDVVPDVVPDKPAPAKRVVRRKVRDQAPADATAGA